LDFRFKLFRFAFMRKAFVIILISIIVLQCGIKSFYVAYYQINKKYIAATLCENRAKPASTCKGKCYLLKKMRQQEQQEQTIPSVLKGLDEVVLFYSEFSVSFTAHFPSDAPLALGMYQMPQYASPTDQIIQPPQ
jgi:hypothetical protein